MKAVHQQGVFDGLIEVAAGFDHVLAGGPGPGPDGHRSEERRVGKEC